MESKQTSPNQAENNITREFFYFAAYEIWVDYPTYIEKICSTGPFYLNGKLSAETIDNVYKQVEALCQQDRDNQQPLLDTHPSGKNKKLGIQISYTITNFFAAPNRPCATPS